MDNSDKQNLDQSHEDNLVVLPFGKKAEGIVPNLEYADDPLESLLNEFEEIERELNDSRLSGHYEHSPSISKAIKSLPQTATQGLLPEEHLEREFTKALEFETRLNLIHEVNKRIQYYLDEIELFIPTSKK